MRRCRPPRRAAFPLVLVPALFTLASCAVNPATGERQLSLISEGREVEMGREYHEQVSAQMGVVDDAELQAWVQDLGERLAAESERPDLPWSFQVVDDPAVNAFALPGGFIYVTRGILAHLDSEAELAAVLGHEIGHVTARHSVNQMSEQMVAQLGLGVAAATVPEIGDYAGVASAGLGLLFLKYGRDDERQSDDLGLRYMRRAGYDAREMPDVFAMLGRATQAAGGGGTPEWLSTHPAPENRHERVTAMLDSIPASELEDGRVRRAEYLERIDGMVYGADPRQGFFRDGVFLHPGLEFRIAFPSGWQTANQRQAVLAASPDEDAMMQLTLAEAESAGLAARAFAAQDGIQADPPRRLDDGERGSVVVDFRAAPEDGPPVAGSAAFFHHGDVVFQLLSYAAADRWPSYRRAAYGTRDSFGTLTDPEALDAQPLRLEIVRLERASTLRTLARSWDSPVELDRLVLINGVEAGTPLREGRRVKRVVGSPVS